MQELLLGTAYYPEYMPYPRIEKDIQMMRDAGMNVVRIAESTWSTLEPRAGQFDFSYIDEVLAVAEKYDMKVVIGTPTYATPAWLIKEDADIMVTTKTGQSRYGHRQLMDIINPIFRQHAEQVICRLAEHTAGHRQVIGFQIDNETKHYYTSGERVQSLFIAYLKEKLGTTEALNQTFGLAYWSNSISDWDMFPDIRGCVNGGLASEFEKFQRQLAEEYLSWQAKLVGQYKQPHQFITHNFDFEWKKFGADIAQDGYSYGVQPDIDHSRAAKCLTLAGTDIYHPTQDQLTGAEIAFGGDEIRCLKHAPYLVLECQAQAFKYWTPYPGQLRLHAYSHLASGALGISYWNWHSIHNGFETYWKGVLSHDLDTNPAYEEVKQFGREWSSCGRDALCIRKKNDVALVIDNETLTGFKWFPIDRDLSYNDVVRWMYDSLYEINIECDVIFADELNCDSYRMIITPALYSASEATIEKLIRFVENGGVLISSFKSFVADRYLSVYPDTQPHRLHECFGMSYNQFTEPGTTEIKGSKVSYFAELIKAGEAEVIARYEHPYWQEYAGITRNSYGAGTAYYFGCYTDKRILKELYRKAAVDAQIDGAEQNYEWPVIIRSGQNERGRPLHYILHYSSRSTSILCPYENARDILTGKEYHQGEEITLSDWAVIGLEEQI